jgi:indole-3-glycerol phosphate synthase
VVYLMKVARVLGLAVVVEVHDADAVLVGEALMRQPDVTTVLEQLISG